MNTFLCVSHWAFMQIMQMRVLEVVPYLTYSVHYFGDVNYSRFKSGAGKRPMERTLPPSGIQAEHFVFFSAAAAAEKWIRVGVWGGKRSSNQPAATRATKRVIHTGPQKDSAGGCSRLEDDTAATNNNYHQMFVSLLGVAMKKTKQISLSRQHGRCDQQFTCNTAV